MKKILIAFSTIMLVTLHSNIHAQYDSSNFAKLDAKTKAALVQRYEWDKSYTQMQRNAADNNLNTWLGENLSELITQWGAYSRIVDDGAGGKIVVYESVVSGTTGSYTPGSISWDDYGNVTNYSVATDTRSNYSYTAYREVYVDKNNIITKIKTGTR